MSEPIETGNPEPTASAGDQTWREVSTKSVEASSKFALYGVSPQQIVADHNDYDPQDSPVLRLSTDASRTLTGLSRGERGRTLVVVNVGSFGLTLSNESSSSSAENRLVCPDSSDLTLGANDTASLWYDVTTLRWRVVSTSVAPFSPTNMLLPNFANTAHLGLLIDSANGYAYAVATGASYGHIFRWAMHGSALFSKGLGTTQYFRLDTAYGQYLGDICDDADYIYGYLQRQGDSAWLPVRMAKSDGALTEITVSGTAPPSAQSNVATDGTDFYVHEIGSVTVRRYTASGTTWTYHSQITLADNANAIALDGTGIWYVTALNGGASTNDSSLYRAAMDGSTVWYRNIQEAVYSGGLGLDTDRGYLWGHFRERAAASVTEQSTWIIPIEKI